MTDVGFTGTRYGTTREQWQTMSHVIRQEFLAASEEAVFHHGACAGSDAEAHMVAWSLGYAITVHPPLDGRLRAWVEQSAQWDPVADRILPARPYIERNHDIVDAVSVLIATPDGPERERSGTWATIRYAREKGVPTTIVMPDGSLA